MLDHIGLPVSDFERSKAFYTAVLAPLGISLLLEKDLSDEGGPAGYCGFGVDRPQFWIGTGKPFTGRLHVAFAATSRNQVSDFYKAALAAGAKDNGPPGLRPHYHANYFGAFVIDPDGHNVEAVSHLPE
ncbi:MAG: VOC family protein [Hyphomicrobium sp.]|uniref:VOC family protein n=1 Tax=Hyphomicrobium sp. TaxID=82 RepID=UPI0025C1F510|nr:VOC family protein [Hyphomicrobium sp.]MBX9863791.1 VOC family protein [Hyphomicrobium sp.]